ncbi:MAG: hypothetical protein WC335_08915 [Candidatus Omnitrophota bacterium]|jgi:hypothetical protein
MKNLWNEILLFSFIFFFAAAASACFAKDKKGPDAPITIEARVDRTAAAIGDKIQYEIVIQKTKDIEIEPFVFGQNLGDFVIKDFGSKRSVFLNKEKITQWYILDTYITGKTTIPKVVLKYKLKTDKDWHLLEAGEIAIEIKSTLDKTGPGTQMRDVKDPVGLPSAIHKYLILAVLFIAAVVGVWAGYVLKRNKEEPVIPIKPAHEIAYEQLEHLRGKNYIALNKIKEYYIEVSDIIRHYCENRFKLRAPEMTTEEFLMSTRDSAELTGGHKGLLKEFLICCDLVKFAKYAPPADEANSVFDSAKHFIDQTKENDPA